MCIAYWLLFSFQGHGHSRRRPLQTSSCSSRTTVSDTLSFHTFSQESIFLVRLDVIVQCKSELPAMNYKMFAAFAHEWEPSPYILWMFVWQPIDAWANILFKLFSRYYPGVMNSNDHGALLKTASVVSWGILNYGAGTVKEVPKGHPDHPDQFNHQKISEIMTQERLPFT